eukprot:TRINITY_DN8144_c0_g3_i2.p1 TRINITY_DN8144_c0_g3~~TRINITY_DN8144_c0_g3_i2.p1  ORF type:complete len:343 (-),score=41.63 TRINITY_DN8144_c0_g3_i2:437-1465(-)
MLSQSQFKKQRRLLARRRDDAYTWYLQGMLAEHRVNYMSKLSFEWMQFAGNTVDEASECVESKADVTVQPMSCRVDACSQTDAIAPVQRKSQVKSLETLRHEVGTQTKDATAKSRLYESLEEKRAAKERRRAEHDAAVARNAQRRRVEREGAILRPSGGRFIIKRRSNDLRTLVEVALSTEIGINDVACEDRFLTASRARRVRRDSGSGASVAGTAGAGNASPIARTSVKAGGPYVVDDSLVQPTDTDIKLVMLNAKCSRERAEKTLKTHKNDIVEAIAHLQAKRRGRKQLDVDASCVEPEDMDIKVVMVNAHCSRETALKTLMAYNNDIADAIAHLQSRRA